MAMLVILAFTVLHRGTAVVVVRLLGLVRRHTLLIGIGSTPLEMLRSQPRGRLVRRRALRWALDRMLYTGLPLQSKSILHYMSTT